MTIRHSSRGVPAETVHGASSTSARPADPIGDFTRRTRALLDVEAKAMAGYDIAFLTWSEGLRKLGRDLEQDDEVRL